MRGRRKTYRIDLSPQEQQRLEHLVAARSTPQSIALRGRVVLACHAHPDHSDERCAQRLGVSPQMVRKWRRRYVETRSLEEAPRSGRPRTFSP